MKWLVPMLLLAKRNGKVGQIVQAHSTVQADRTSSSLLDDRMEECADLSADDVPIYPAESLSLCALCIKRQGI